MMVAGGASRAGQLETPGPRPWGRTGSSPGSGCRCQGVARNRHIRGLWLFYGEVVENWAAWAKFASFVGFMSACMWAQHHLSVHGLPWKQEQPAEDVCQSSD